MRIIRRRSTAWIAALAYFVASALSGLLHNHSHPGHSEACETHVAGCGEAHRDGLPSDSCETASLPERGLPPDPLSDEDCPACRFVAQCAVVSVPAADLTPLRVVAEVGVSAPVFFIEPIFSNGLARAPPLG
ncbi:MAG TPA: hypothetical protein VHC22_06690 [Pirellulales bacterium]|nr:hypothetical protein [Pirellulales bacterium]